jgi:hypothetical protein
LLVIPNATINASVTVRNTIGAHIYTSHLKILVKKILSDLFLSKYSHKFMTKYCIWQHNHSFIHWERGCKDDELNKDNKANGDGDDDESGKDGGTDGSGKKDRSDEEETNDELDIENEANVNYGDDGRGDGGNGGDDNHDKKSAKEGGYEMKPRPSVNNLV